MATDDEMIAAGYVESALAMLVQSEFTGPSYYAICRKLEDALAACKPDWRPVGQGDEQ